METEFVILYTHQKTKKAKTWQDGTLKVSSSQNRAVLYDDKKSKLDALYVRPGQVCAGEELESERYLIQVEQQLETSQTQNVGVEYQRAPLHGGPNATTGTGSAANRSSSLPETRAGPAGSYMSAMNPVSGTTQQGLRVGLKRKKTGFIPPRQVKAARQEEPQEDEEPLTALQVLNARRNQLYGMGPLSSSSAPRTKPDLQAAQPSMVTTSAAKPPSMFNLYTSVTNRASPEAQSHLNVSGPGQTLRLPPPTSRPSPHDQVDVSSPGPAPMGVRRVCSVKDGDISVGAWEDQDNADVNSAVSESTTRHGGSAVDVQSPPPPPPPPCQNADDDQRCPSERVLPSDSRAIDDLLLSQDTRRALSVYDRMLSTIDESSSGPSPWSVVGRRPRPEQGRGGASPPPPPPPPASASNPAGHPPGGPPAGRRGLDSRRDLRHRPAPTPDTDCKSSPVSAEVPGVSERRSGSKLKVPWDEHSGEDRAISSGSGRNSDVLKEPGLHDCSELAGNPNPAGASHSLKKDPVKGSLSKRNTSEILALIKGARATNERSQDPTSLKEELVAPRDKGFDGSVPRENDKKRLIGMHSSENAIPEQSHEALLIYSDVADVPPTEADRIRCSAIDSTTNAKGEIGEELLTMGATGTESSPVCGVDLEGEKDVSLRTRESSRPINDAVLCSSKSDDTNGIKPAPSTRAAMDTFKNSDHRELANMDDNIGDALDNPAHPADNSGSIMAHHALGSESVSKKALELEEIESDFEVSQYWGAQTNLPDVRSETEHTESEMTKSPGPPSFARVGQEVGEEGVKIQCAATSRRGGTESAREMSAGSTSAPTSGSGEITATRRSSAREVSIYSSSVNVTCYDTLDANATVEKCNQNTAAVKIASPFTQQWQQQQRHQQQPSQRFPVSDEACFEIGFSPLSETSNLSDEDDQPIRDVIPNDEEPEHSFTASPIRDRLSDQLRQAPKTPDHDGGRELAPPPTCALDVTDEDSGSSANLQNSGLSRHNSRTETNGSSGPLQSPQHQKDPDHCEQKVNISPPSTKVNGLGSVSAGAYSGRGAVDGEMLNRVGENSVGVKSDVTARVSPLNAANNGMSVASDMSTPSPPLPPPPPSPAGPPPHLRDGSDAEGCAAGREDASCGLITGNARSDDRPLVGCANVTTAGGEAVGGDHTNKAQRPGAPVTGALRDEVRVDVGQPIDSARHVNEDGRAPQSQVAGFASTRRETCQTDPPVGTLMSPGAGSVRPRLLQHVGALNGPPQQANPSTSPAAIEAACGAPSMRACASKAGVINSAAPLNGQSPMPAAGAGAPFVAPSSMAAPDSQLFDGSARSPAQAQSAPDTPVPNKAPITVPSSVDSQPGADGNHPVNEWREPEPGQPPSGQAGPRLPVVQSACTAMKNNQTETKADDRMPIARSPAKPTGETPEVEGGTIDDDFLDDVTGDVAPAQADMCQRDASLTSARPNSEEEPHIHENQKTDEVSKNCDMKKEPIVSNTHDKCGVSTLNQSPGPAKFGLKDLEFSPEIPFMPVGDCSPTTGMNDPSLPRLFRATHSKPDVQMAAWPAPSSLNGCRIPGIKVSTATTELPFDTDPALLGDICDNRSQAVDRTSAQKEARPVPPPNSTVDRLAFDATKSSTVSLPESYADRVVKYDVNPQQKHSVISTYEWPSLQNDADRSEACNKGNVLRRASQNERRVDVNEVASFFGEPRGKRQKESANSASRTDSQLALKERMTLGIYQHDIDSNSKALAESGVMEDDAVGVTRPTTGRYPPSSRGGKPCKQKPSVPPPFPAGRHLAGVGGNDCLTRSSIHQHISSLPLPPEGAACGPRLPTVSHTEYSTQCRAPRVAELTATPVQLGGSHRRNSTRKTEKFETVASKLNAYVLKGTQVSNTVYRDNRLSSFKEQTSYEDEETRNTIGCRRNDTSLRSLQGKESEPHFVFSPVQVGEVLKESPIQKVPDELSPWFSAGRSSEFAPLDDPVSGNERQTTRLQRATRQDFPPRDKEEAGDPSAPGNIDQTRHLWLKTTCPGGGGGGRPLGRPERGRAPLRSAPFDDPVVHTSYSTSQAKAVPSGLSPPSQVVPLLAGHDPLLGRARTPPRNPLARPTWLDSPGNLSILDSPLLDQEDSQRRPDRRSSEAIHSRDGDDNRSNDTKFGFSSEREGKFVCQKVPTMYGQTTVSTDPTQGTILGDGDQWLRDPGDKKAVFPVGGDSCGAIGGWQSSQDSTCSETSDILESSSQFTSCHSVVGSRPGGLLSKWDIFKEHKEGEGEEEEGRARGHPGYHGRFSPPVRAASGQKPAWGSSGGAASEEDEWQEQFIVSEGQGTSLQNQQVKSNHREFEREVYLPEDVRGSVRGSPPTCSANSVTSQYFSPVASKENQSPAPPSFFLDTPHNSPGGSSVAVVPSRTTRGRLPNFRAPRPLGATTAGNGGSSAHDRWRRPRADVGTDHSVQPGVRGKVSSTTSQSAVAVTDALRSAIDEQPARRRLLLCGELRFPSLREVEDDDEAATPQRRTVIPASFVDVHAYRRALVEALREHLNTQLFDLAKRYHLALSRVDTTGFEPENQGPLHRRGRQGSVATNTNPHCEHGVPSKVVQVKKPGANQGRFFFTCANDRSMQCGFFKWANETQKKAANNSRDSTSSLALSDGQSITTFLKSAGISFYSECQLVRKEPPSFQRKNIPNWVKKKMGYKEEDSSMKKLYLKLPRKEASSSYAKDDLWVLLQQLDCSPLGTALVRSAFYGPSTTLDLEIEPVGAFSPSNWPNGTVCHALHAGNASTELSCISNLEALSPSVLPILPHLLNRTGSVQNQAYSSRFMAPKMQEKEKFFVPKDMLDDISEELIEKYHLNEDQTAALRRIASMFAKELGVLQPAITLIHGVFGAGKSYLLAVVVLLLVRVFELNESFTPGVPEQLKLLISSTTNVAVDRILLGLLDLGYDNFVRVGSVKKIAKPILPYSVHAAGSDNQELRDLQEMLKSPSLTPTEKFHVRKSIEERRKGDNKKRLTKVPIVGVTCAACVFPCLQTFKFSVVLLDECSQMTEPMSLLPIAKFGCEKLVLVGDPKQLNPTIQGSESDSTEGLEQTLFDRLTCMGHEAVMLRTQYRCHPLISAIPNALFYEHQLKDGITAADRPPLAPGWPALCFFDVPDGQEKSASSGSFSNEKEAELVVELIAKLVGAEVEPNDIGVITLYRAQQARILQLLQQHDSDLRAVQVSTVDAFQGGERGIIFLSCVRTHYVGFIDSDKRTNVALSRAKNHLFIVGHRRNLTNNSLWRKVIKHCLEAPNGLKKGKEFLLSLGDDGASEANEATTCLQKTCPSTGTSSASSPLLDLTPASSVGLDSLPDGEAANILPQGTEEITDASAEYQSRHGVFNPDIFDDNELDSMCFKPMSTDDTHIQNPSADETLNCSF